MQVIKELNNMIALAEELNSLLPAVEVPRTIGALEMLKEEYGIKYTINEAYPRLVVLNYDQIDSPKLHPITTECRSLVVETPPIGSTEWRVVSRSFDRFLNLGESGTSVNMEHMTAHEKMDGSLIGLFFYDNEWLYRTRSMIMPVNSINGLDLTWDKLIEEAIGRTWNVDMFQDIRFFDHFTSITYICEVTSPENRVVTRYKDRELTLLAMRYNESGAYVDSETCDRQAKLYLWNRPGTFTFKSVEACVLKASSLRELKEGFVLYDRHNAPVCKVKNPAYVAAHHLRGEGVLTPKRILDLLFMGEVDEYLSIFEEDRTSFEPYIAAYDSMWAHAEQAWDAFGDIESQKEFALAIKDLPIKHLLFKRRQGIDFRDAFQGFFPDARYDLVREYL